ncbi:hypothetical protein JCM17843_25280 [Kordiimonadales bacterium JCM 17843]|nr:hypothetical protein JCM17843_25280 [Kordiimonadales bacterium JCM 17843]
MRHRLGGEQKESAVSGLGYAKGRYPGAALLSMGSANWSARSYQALVQNGFRDNVVANRAVRLVAECAASVPIHVMRADHRVAAHPLLDVLASPNPMQDGASFLEQVYAWLLLAGNAYIERVEASSGRVAELYALRPERMTVVPGARGWPEAYDYRLGGHVHRFKVHQPSGRSPILHLKNFHPADDHYGLSALEAAAKSMDVHNAASSWNKALLDNAARPSGALVFEPGDGVPGNLTDEQVSRLKSEMEAQFQGAANAGRPLLLEGGLKWQQMAFSPADMDFINTKNVAAREIALAFGVPPMLLGIPGDNTYANYQEANRALWRLTLLPLVDRVLLGLSRFLSKEGDAVRLVADRDALPALAVEREALWARVGAAAFLTVNEQRAAVGLEPVAGGDALSVDRGEDPRPFDFGGQASIGRQMKGQAVVATRAARFADLKRDFEAAKADGKPHKIWRTRKDGDVRSSHAAMDGVEVGIDARFDVHGEQLLLPSDPAGSFEQTANCRCFVDYVDEGEGEVGRFPVLMVGLRNFRVIGNLLKPGKAVCAPMATFPLIKMASYRPERRDYRCRCGFGAANSRRPCGLGGG